MVVTPGVELCSNQFPLEKMEGTISPATVHVKLSLRELNLKRGGNNVRWLNEREDRLLETSLKSMEKAHKIALSRLGHEVKDLQSILREQGTVRSTQRQKVAHLTEHENSGTRRRATTMQAVTFDLRREHLSSVSKSDDEIPGSVVEEVEDVENILFEDTKNINQKIQKGLVSNGLPKQTAWTRKQPSTLKRPISKQLSSSVEYLSTSSSSLSVPCRKISVTDPLPTGELSLSPGLRKKISVSCLQLNADNISGTVNYASPPLLRKVSQESTRQQQQASPLFIRRTLSASNPPRKTTSPNSKRKIFTTSQVQHLPKVQQEQKRPSQSSRDHSVVDMPNELPKLEIPRGLDPGLSFDGNVSPIHPGVDDVDCTLQEKVNNFLRSLQKGEQTEENEG